MNSISSNLQLKFGSETNWNRNMNWSRNLVIDTKKRIDRESMVYCSRRERKRNSRATENMEEKKGSYCSLGSVILSFYIWINSIQMTTSKKKSIEMTTSEKRSMQMATSVAASSYMDLLPKEIIEDEFLIRCPLKTLMSLKCVSKDWNDFVSDDNFRRRYRSLQQRNGKTPTGFICGDIIDDNAIKHGFVVANKFLYTSESYVEKEELKSFDYLKTCGRYVIASSKGLLLVGDDLKMLSVYDLVSKKHVNLPRNNIERVNFMCLGFKCEERSSNSSSNHHLWSSYKVVCVESYGNDTSPEQPRYNVEIYSSETGTWKKSIMRSPRFYFQIWYQHIAKVIRGVFYWHECYHDTFIAYDSEDPTGHVVLIELPKINNIIHRKKLRQLEGTKDGSLQFFSMDDMVLKVWILLSTTSGRNYMDEDIVDASRWSLASSVCLGDIGVCFGDIYFLEQKRGKRIICADPVYPHILYLEILGQLYAYDYRKDKVVFTFSQTLAWDTDVFLHFEWPTWPCL